MKTKQSLFLIFIFVMAVLLVACGGTAEPTTVPATTPPEPEPTEEPVSDAPPSSVRTFVVVPEESQASYMVDEEFLADALSKLGIEAGKTVVIGTTSGVTGEIQLNLESTEPIESAQFAVDMTGLRTDQDRRDGWLEDNAIETSQFPEASFTTTSVAGMPETITEGEEVNFQLLGDLKVRDVTQNVTFDVTAVLSGDTLQGTAVLPLKMTDFGIDPPDFANTLTVADDFSIEVTLTAREQ